MKTSELTTKQLQRLERKKKKISAFLTIAKLNDQDRYDRQIKLMQKIESHEEEEDEDQEDGEQEQKNSDKLSNGSLIQIRGEGPCRKKLKRDEVIVHDPDENFVIGTDIQSDSILSNNTDKKDIDQPYPLILGQNYNCAENSFMNYYNSPVDVTQYYEESVNCNFLPLNITTETNRACNNYVEYHSYEVRGHHNSETYYFKADEHTLDPADGLPDGKLTYILENWNGLIYSRKSRSGNVTSTGKPLLQGESYEELKRQLRERKNLYKVIPRIVLKESGERASLDTDETKRVPLFISDIQDLLVYSQTEHTFYKPRWCNLEKPNRLSKSIVLIVEGIRAEDFTSNEASLSAFKDKPFNKVEILMPNAYDGNLVEELSAVPLCPAQQRKLRKDYGRVSDALPSKQHLRYRVIRALFPIIKRDSNLADVELPEGDKFPRTDLLLSAWQLVEENYPIPFTGPLKNKYENYVPTKDKYSEVTPQSPLFALDCEMCRTETGALELTRISIVNENLEVLYDSLVKPWNKITDYLTRYSGITKKMLDPVTTRLVDVQRKVREILPPDAILVGQSLNCDLNAMQMMHPYVIDTSVIFNITGVRSKKTKLMTLSREFLSERIQDSKRGHCSKEDSSACMKLVKLKLAHSLEFGDAVLVGRPAAELHLQEIQLQNKKNGSPIEVQVVEKLTTSLFHQIANSKKKGAVVGSQEVVNAYSDLSDKEKSENLRENILGFVTGSNKQAVEKACQIAEDNDFVLAHLKLDEDELGNGDNSSKGICFTHINRVVQGPAL